MSKKKVLKVGKAGEAKAMDLSSSRQMLLNNANMICGMIDSQIGNSLVWLKPAVQNQMCFILISMVARIMVEGIQQRTDPTVTATTIKMAIESVLDQYQLEVDAAKKAAAEDVHEGMPDKETDPKLN